MATSTIAAGGTITLGDLTVHRLDLGAMRITLVSFSECWARLTE